MAEQLHCPAHDEQADAETIETRRVRPLKGVENLRQVLGSYAYSRVVNLDSDVVFDSPTANQDASTRLRILDGVAHQIAQDGSPHRLADERSLVDPTTCERRLDCTPISGRRREMMCRTTSPAVADEHRGLVGEEENRGRDLIGAAA